MFIVDDAVDAALPLPGGEYDLPLVITERSFDDGSNQLATRSSRITDEPLLARGAAPATPPDDDLSARQCSSTGSRSRSCEVEPRRLPRARPQRSPLRPYNLLLSDRDAALHPDRDRERAAARAGPAHVGPARPGRAGRADRRLLRARRPERQAAQPRAGPTCCPGPVPHTGAGFADFLEFRVPGERSGRRVTSPPRCARCPPGSPRPRTPPTACGRSASASTRRAGPPGPSTAGRSTTSGSTPSPSSAPSRPGCSSTPRPTRCRTTSTSTTWTGWCLRATAMPPAAGEDGAQGDVPARPGRGRWSRPASSPTTSATTCSTATCSSTRTTG